MNRILILLASLLFVGESFAFPPCPTSGYRDNCFGTHTWADGNEYAGEFKDNQFHGQGTLTLLDGSKFDGEWKGGKPYGQGTFTFADGREYAAEYKDGEFKLFRMKRGNVYEDQITMEHMGGTYIGEVSDGVPHGHGTLTFADGTKYVGEFRGQKFWYGAKYDNSGRLIATYSAGVEEENVDLGPQIKALHEKLQVFLKEAFYLTPGPISEGTLDNPGPPISETCPADVAKRIQAVFDEEIKKLYEPVKRELVLETSSQLVNKLVNQFSQPDARLIVDALGQSLNWSKEEQEAFNNTDLGKRSQHVLFSDLMRAMEQLGQRFAQVFPEAFEKTETRLKLEGITKVNEDNWCLEN